MTNQQLRNLLHELGFTVQPSATASKCVVFEHAQSGAKLLLPANKDNEPARHADVLSIRTHLHYRGHLDEAQFDRYQRELERRAS